MVIQRVVSAATALTLSVKTHATAIAIDCFYKCFGNLQTYNFSPAAGACGYRGGKEVGCSADPAKTQIFFTTSMFSQAALIALLKKILRISGQFRIYFLVMQFVLASFVLKYTVAVSASQPCGNRWINLIKIYDKNLIKQIYSSAKCVTNDQ